MKRSELKRTTELRRSTPLTAREAVREGRRDASLARRSTLKRSGAISPASPAQREKVKLMACAVCEGEPCDPAHLISRGLLTEGQDDPRAVIPLCRGHHDAYDHGSLSLLEHLEPHYRVELAFAVERFGLVSTLRRVTNEREYEQGAAA